MAASQSTQTQAQSEELKAQKFDLSIALILHTWSALTVAVDNSWGGPTSASKRDWFAGAVSDFFATSAADPSSFTAAAAAASGSATTLRELGEDVECLLLEIMEDEFDVRLEDESEVDIAARIVGAWRLCGAGAFGEVDEMFRVWKEREDRRALAGGGNVRSVTVQTIEEEGEWGEDGDDDEEEEGDVEMDDAPPRLVPVKENPAPEVDEDGFTKVVGKKKR